MNDKQHVNILDCTLRDGGYYNFWKFTNEIFKDEERINPINFYYGSLTAEEFNKMLEHASLENQSLD